MSNETKIKLREGGYYRRQDGNVIGPLRKYRENIFEAFHLYNPDGTTFCRSEVNEHFALVTEVYVSDVFPVPQSHGVEAIAAERRRQIEVEGYTAEYDDMRATDGLVALAGEYINGLRGKSAREQFVKAGALIAAEIDRLDRAEAKVAKGKAQS